MWIAGLMLATWPGSAGPAFGFGEVYELTGSGKTWHFEGGSYVAAPVTGVNSTVGSAFIAANLDPGGKAYGCWSGATTFLVDVDPAFPNPVIFTGLLSTSGDFMVHTNQDGRAVIFTGRASLNVGTQAVTRFKGEVFVLTGPLMSPANFDHFSRSKAGSAALVSTGGCP